MTSPVPDDPIDIDIDPLPDIDPAAHAIASYAWGDREALYLVPRDGTHIVWTVRTADECSWAVALPGEAAARDYMAAQFARTLFTDTEEEVAKASASDPDGGFLYDALVADGGEAGIWLAIRDADGEQSDENATYALTGFTDLDTAVEALARSAEQAAERIAARPKTRYPALLRAHLRDQAARARASAARAALGEAVRRDAERLRAERAVRGAAYGLGVSREFLYRVMGSGEWTWKGAGAGVPPPAPPRPPEPGGPALDWLIRVNLGVTGDTATALRVARAVLAEMAVPVPDALTAVPHGVGTWAVQAELDLDGQEFEPDDASMRLTHVTRNLPGVDWTGTLAEDGRAGVRRWPPGFFATNPDTTFPFPEVVAIEITATSRPKEAAADG